MADLPIFEREADAKIKALEDRIAELEAALDKEHCEQCANKPAVVHSRKTQKEKHETTIHSPATLANVCVCGIQRAIKS